MMRHLDSLRYKSTDAEVMLCVMSVAGILACSGKQQHLIVIGTARLT